MKKNNNKNGPQITGLSSASLRSWNDGMLEYWNNGMAPFGQINAYGEDGWDQGYSASYSLPTSACNAIIPLFHHSIIPVRNMQNGGLEIPYYHQFVEFPRHKNKKICENLCNLWANKIRKRRGNEYIKTF